MNGSARIREADSSDRPRLEEIRRAAFEPVFASFPALLGDQLYELVPARDDEAQPQLSASLLAPDSSWQVYVTELGDAVVGFVAIRLCRETNVGEIGLNAVDPAHAGEGVGTGMYEFALARRQRRV